MRPGRRRRPKTSHSQINDESSDEDSTLSGNESSSDDEEEPQQRQQSESDAHRKSTEHPKSSSRRNRRVLDGRIPEVEEELRGWSAATRRKLLAFCCAKCQCPTDHKQKFAFRPEERYAQTTVDHYYHRRCCHALKEWEYNSSLPNDHTFQTYQECQEAILLGQEPTFQPPKPDIVLCKKKYVEEKSKNLVQQVVKDDNNDTGSYDPVQILKTNPEYMANLRRVRELPKDTHRGIRVLSLFSGCGTAEVVLKKLGIQIDRLVTCEADKVAAFVCKEHHDVDCHVGSFEKLEDPANLDHVLEHFGPFDLVVAGPPCIDYSGANAWRQGAHGSKGSYMLRVGNLLKCIQQHERQKGVHVHFLIENVRIHQQKEVPFEKTDLIQIEKHFGVTWHVELDALYFSPCRRLRYFFTNIPLDGYDFGLVCAEDDHFNPQTCLTSDGYHLASHFYAPAAQTKVNTFMACKSRLDDPRMELFQKTDKKGFRFRTLTALERSDLMGYPEDYFSPVDTLFRTLLEVFMNPCHQAGENGEDDRFHWRNTLDQKFLCFQGAYNGNRDSYNLKMDHEYCLHLEMAPPGKSDATGKPNSLYDCEKYKKRLIGNAFSIPVLEHLLKPLCTLFASKKYRGYNYKYKWQQSKIANAQNEHSIGTKRALMQTEIRRMRLRMDEDDSLDV